MQYSVHLTLTFAEFHFVIILAWLGFTSPQRSWHLIEGFLVNRQREYKWKRKYHLKIEVFLMVKLQFITVPLLSSLLFRTPLLVLFCTRQRYRGKKVHAVLARRTTLNWRKVLVGMLLPQATPHELFSFSQLLKTSIY